MGLVEWIGAKILNWICETYQIFQFLTSSKGSQTPKTPKTPKSSQIPPIPPSFPIRPATSPIKKNFRLLAQEK